MESNLFIKDWLTQSWGLKGPIICHLQAQESQRCSSSPVVVRLKTQEDPMLEFKGRKNQPQIKGREVKEFPPTQR
jgi:hypothetical protein